MEDMFEEIHFLVMEQLYKHPCVSVCEFVCQIFFYDLIGQD